MKKPVVKFITFLFAVFLLLSAPGLMAAPDFPGGVTGVNIDLVPNEVLVEFESDESTLSPDTMAEFGILTEMGKLTYRPVRRYLLKNNLDPFSLIPKLEALPGVKGAYPNYYRHAMLVPKDSLYNMQKPYYDLLNMEDAWDIEIGDGTVVVAVIDTGVDPDHPELKANLIPGKNVVSALDEADDYVNDDSGHGTAVIGVIGAIGNNSQGVAGISWNVKIMPIRACYGEYLVCSIWDEIEGIDTAREAGVDIINMSIGGKGTMTLEEQAAADAWAAGIIMFAAAGNDNEYLKATGTPKDRQTLYYPAALPEVIGVGAVDNELNKADFSNYGEVVSEIYAPGVEIISTIPTYPVSQFPGQGPPYGKIDGTSFSCPMAAGTAVLLKSHFPELGPADIMQRLFSTAIPLGNLDADGNGVDDYFGYGLINPVAALSPPTKVSSEYFDLGISGSPIFENDIYVFVRVKKPIIGNPVVTYSVAGADEEGEILLRGVDGVEFYMGVFNTDHNGQVRVNVTGYVGGELLPEISISYIVKDI